MCCSPITEVFQGAEEKRKCGVMLLAVRVRIQIDARVSQRASGKCSTCLTRELDRLSHNNVMRNTSDSY